MDQTVVWVIMGVALTSIVSAINQLRSEIARTNSTLDKIAKQIGVPGTVPENLDNELKTLIAEGKKIKAIKRHRMLTGLGLKESKEYIDSLSK
jgi:ribosomal protein L7/L12